MYQKNIFRCTNNGVRLPLDFGTEHSHDVYKLLLFTLSLHFWKIFVFVLNKVYVWRYEVRIVQVSGLILKTLEIPCCFFLLFCMFLINAFKAEWVVFWSCDEKNTFTLQRRKILFAYQFHDWQYNFIYDIFYYIGCCSIHFIKIFSIKHLIPIQIYLQKWWNSLYYIR